MTKSAQPSLNRWLVLSHAFNMDGRAASQTITDKIPHLMARGIEPVVLSGVLGEKSYPFPHYRLLPLGPAALRFDLRFVLRKWLGKGVRYQVGTAILSLLFAPFILLEKLILGRQSQWSWAFSAYLFGLWAIRHHAIDCIYATGGAYSAQWAGLWLKRTTGLPLLIEVHDPLVFRGQQDARLSSRDAAYQAKLETAIAAKADLVWWFTQGALDAAKARYPILQKNGLMIIPGANPPAASSGYARGQKMVFAHFGSLASARSLNRFFLALKIAIQKIPALVDVLEVHIYGGELDALSKAALVETGLNRLVVVWGRLELDTETGLSGRAQVMQRMARADVLLLPHGEIDNCAEYIPSKLYEYFWAQRPILGLTHLNPQIDSMILARGGYVASAVSNQEIQQSILAAYTDWQEAKSGSAFAADGQPWRASVPPIGVEGCVNELLQAMHERGITAGLAVNK